MDRYAIATTMAAVQDDDVCRKSVAGVRVAGSILKASRRFRCNEDRIQVSEGRLHIPVDLPAPRYHPAALGYNPGLVQH